MLPDIYIAPAVSKEIVMDRERRIARRQILRELPAAPSRGMAMRRRLAGLIGVQMVKLGERLRSYAQPEFTSDAWIIRSQAK